MAQKNTKGWAWSYVDGWVFCKGDDANAPALARQFKEEHPKGYIRTYRRDVRAGGGTIPITVVVVREKVPCCTCGEAYGTRPVWLPVPCAYCANGADHLETQPARV